MTLPILFGQQEIVAKLDRRTSLNAILADSKKYIQNSVVRIPINTLEHLSWFENRHDVALTYRLNGKKKRYVTYINTPEEIAAFVQCLESKLGSTFRTEERPAGVFKVAWSNIAGAIVSLVGVWHFYFNWDPVALARIRNGKIPLTLGREGCAAVGIGIFAACCICGWNAIGKHSIQYFRHIAGSTDSTM